MASRQISLTDQAYEIIKENILQLKYPPGMPLTEAMLTEELNMSRNPVRTALKMLQSEGLIVSDYYRSMTVREITDQDIRELYDLRELLEGEAFRRIFSEARADEYSYRIEEKVVRMCACAANPYEWEKADMQMHLEIISIYSSERLNKFYRSNLAELIRIGLYSLKGGMEIQTTNDHLKKMVAYMRENDFEKAYEILHGDHFMTGKNSALKR